jgi:hypothetical protein
MCHLAAKKFRGNGFVTSALTPILAVFRQEI